MSSKEKSTAEVPPSEKSNNRIIKEAGFKNFYEFMVSHGLRIYDDNDVQEGKAIVEAFREVDQYRYEVEQQEEKGGKT